MCDCRYPNRMRKIEGQGIYTYVFKSIENQKEELYFQLQQNLKLGYVRLLLT